MNKLFLALVILAIASVADAKVENFSKVLKPGEPFEYLFFISEEGNVSVSIELEDAVETYLAEQRLDF